MGEGADYKSLSKFQIPNQSNLTEISCEIAIGICLEHWTVSEPTPVQISVAGPSSQGMGPPIPPKARKEKFLEHPILPKLDSVRTDPRLFQTLVGKVLGLQE